MVLDASGVDDQVGEEAGGQPEEQPSAEHGPAVPKAEADQLDDDVQDRTSREGHEGALTGSLVTDMDRRRSRRARAGTARRADRVRRRGVR